MTGVEDHDYLATSITTGLFYVGKRKVPINFKVHFLKVRKITSKF